MSELNEILNRDFENWGIIFSVKDFIDKVKENFLKFGFNSINSRLVFCVCPDDINRLRERETIEKSLTAEFNGEFHLGNLAAYPIGGITGIIAASHHVPDKIVDNRAKEGNLIFFISPHVGLSTEGGVSYGKIHRPSQNKLSSCCGAMMAFLDQLKQCKSLQDFKILGDEMSDPTKILLYKAFLNSYSDKLLDIYRIKNENEQVITLAKLNYELVLNKLKSLINYFSENYHIDGDYVLIGGITINTSLKDFLVLKDFEFHAK
jgi:hypothetical protein